MLEVFTKIICSSMMAILGFYIIKTILKSEVKMLSVKTLLLLSILVIATTILYKIQYSGFYTLIIYLLNIIIYKHIFNQKIVKIIIATSMFFIILIILDLVIGIFYTNYISIEQLRKLWYLQLINNFIIMVLGLIMSKYKTVKKNLPMIMSKFENNRYMFSIIFLVLLISVFCTIEINLYDKYGFNIEFMTSAVIMVIFSILLIIFINEKNENEKLTTEYDDLFNYVQNFEDWIEKEQLNRHEYKNQLAVLRCMTKDKKVITKIDEILEDSINIEGEVVNQLKSVPKGGLKGLLYYKAALAQKKKINLTVDISLEMHSIISKLSEQDMRILCKLVGIYFDNAIEAAVETRKKAVSIEIYELKDKVSIVISNTFKQHKLMEKRNEKGVSSKGEGHGNGLYFASKMILKNNWLLQKQDIVDKYYIQELYVKKLNIK